ncbi:G5 domain-containing protein [Oerskovia flava]|uniref:aggregation-promoting factor C-terminal-like domain-containing protein n=1 Tax=Oerskovia flava TaxID=2986422 RepID=UPI0022409319|nr:G5 domain-containing protein [Oerskovia sp. JB1-3-2]
MTDSTLHDVPGGDAPDAATPVGSTAARRRRWPIVAGATAVAVLATGAVAYGNARKTVELDVDGQVVSVTTFAGSVQGLLDEEEISVDERDLVAPGPDAALSNGTDVVVRTARQVTVETDGEQADVWFTVLDADEALETLAARGGDVRLVASRSATDGRASLALSLDTDGPVNVVADGESVVAPDGSIGIDAILDREGIVLEELDRVHVERDESQDPAVSLVVQRVVVEEKKKTKAIDFETVTKTDPDRYEDLDPVVERKGSKGEHTTVYSVTTVDGEEESRETVSKGVTTEPVDKIVVEGTKERPAPEPEPAATSSGSSGSSGSSPGPTVSGSPQEIARQMVADRGWGADQFQCLDNLFTKESNWNPSAQNPSSGAYGIPQSLPGNKMATAGSDWRTNPATQITWGLDYISGRYGTPCGAWAHSQANNWY